MNEVTLSRELSFVVAQRGIDETMVLAQAVQEGMRTLYRDAVIETYLFGGISREDALKELGPEMLNEVEYQRDALKKDIAWGLSDE
ncbi:MAG: hypothetical protein QME81_16655 [bacterium]|nr:hypothetical protein [bacterium]